ncbi:unnamed protein product [Urochloa humidicola]
MSTRFQDRDGIFVDRRLWSSHPRTHAEVHEGRLGGDRQRYGAAVEHDDDGRHAGPELWILLDAKQPDVDAPQHLLRSLPVGRAVVEQLRNASTAPVPPNPPVAGHELLPEIQNN